MQCSVCFTHKRIHSICCKYQTHLQYMQKLECKYYSPIYLSLKCDNSENSLIFKNEEKRWNINTQRNYTYKCNFAFGKPHKYSFYMSKLNYKFSTQMDVHSLCALLFYLLKCGILTAIILSCLISNHIRKLNIASMFIHNCLLGEIT